MLGYGEETGLDVFEIDRVGIVAAQRVGATIVRTGSLFGWILAVSPRTKTCSPSSLPASS